MAYLYPKMPVARYKAQTDEYYRLLTIQAAETVAALSGTVLLPAVCVHHKRRNAERRMTIHGRTYYVVSETDMTPLEYDKYREICRG